MINEEKIKFYLDTFKTLRFEDLANIFALARKRELAAGAAYMKQGDLHRKLSYVVEGLVRSYAFKPSGDEATV